MFLRLSSICHKVEINCIIALVAAGEKKDIPDFSVISCDTFAIVLILDVL